MTDVPPPPPPPPPPVDPAPTGRLNARRMWVGIGLAALGHVLTIVVMVVVIAATPEPEFPQLTGGFAGLIGQGVLLVLALAVGIALVAKGDRSLGLGILIGWAVGLLVFPAVGFGVCVALFSGQAPA